MSYEISYRRQAFSLTAGQAGHYEPVLFLVEEVGSNNCWELDNRRRARSWQCTATGAHWDCMAEITRCAASCCGGCLVLYGRRRIKPEQYIRAWRKALDNAVPLAEAPRLGFRLQLFTRIADSAAQNGRKHDFERLTAESLLTGRRGKCEWSGHQYTEWLFDVAVPEQVKLWLDTREGGRGFNSVDADGPSR